MEEYDKILAIPVTKDLALLFQAELPKMEKDFLPKIKDGSKKLNKCL